MRRLSAILGCLLAAAGLQAATLEKLSFEDLVGKSTAIVRARVTSTYAAARGSLIYTHYRVQVLDRWKGAASSEVDLALPGGTAGGMRQHFAGVPALTVGTEYVLFLWTGPRSGVTQIMGLTQGLFNVKTDANGNILAYRPASADLMLDQATGQPVKDEAMELSLTELGRRITETQTAGAKK
jgi:hypothetical protein